VEVLRDPMAEPSIIEIDRTLVQPGYTRASTQGGRAGDIRADFDGDGALAALDFLASQNAFAAGCA